jgi:AraC-like DNA-binding protein
MKLSMAFEATAFADGPRAEILQTRSCCGRRRYREETTELLKLPSTSSSLVPEPAMSWHENLTPVILELGGQNSALVDKTTNKNLRLEEARFMLQQGRLPVEEIAKAAGFSDRERMRRSFPRTFGKTPPITAKRAALARRHSLYRCLISDFTPSRCPK